MKTLRLRIAADLKNIPAIHRFIVKSARDLFIGPDDIHDLRLAVEEVVSNTIKHGYSGKGGEIEIEFSRTENTGVIQLWDEAEVYDPTVPGPAEISKPLSERPLGGMGLHLLQGAVDEIKHEVRGRGGNHLTLKKYLSGPSTDMVSTASSET